jgi:death-on-curing protein
VTRYLSLSDPLRFAATALGEEPVVRDFGLLQAALARPATTLFGQDAAFALVIAVSEGTLRDLEQIAAALADLTNDPG